MVDIPPEQYEEIGVKLHLLHYFPQTINAGFDTQGFDIDLYPFLLIDNGRGLAADTTSLS